jgi:hypothetical protein
MESDLMPEPATTGKLCTTIIEMKIGDYIKIGSLNNDGWQFNNGTVELPVAGITYSSSFANYYFYMIKVATGLLVSDRVVQHTATWDTFNTNKLIQGLSWTSADGSITGKFRSLSGGSAYATNNGNSSFQSQTVDYGCFPTNNEYDRYILKSDLNGTITANDIAVWNHGTVYTWTQETPLNGIYRDKTNNSTVTINSTYRVARGKGNAAPNWNSYSILGSSNSSATCGYRPVFEYVEV